jgi:hypothetical protein
MQRKLCLLLLASFCFSVPAEAQQTVALRTVEDLVCAAIAQNRDLDRTMRTNMGPVCRRRLKPSASGRNASQWRIDRSVWLKRSTRIVFCN